MTGPTFDEFVNIKPPTQEYEGPDFSEFETITPPRQPGLFGYLGNVAKNLFYIELAHPLGGGAEVFSDGELKSRLIQTQKALAKGRETTIEGLNKAGDDFANFWRTTFKNPENLRKSVKEAWDATWEDPMSLVTALPYAISQFLVVPTEATLGVTLGEDRVRPLSPEERAHKIKETAALALSVETGILGRRFASKLLGGAAAPTRMGRMGQRALIGTAEGLTGGSTYGFVAFANEEDQLAQTLINGVMFAPVGTAFEILLGKNLPRRAEDVADLRRMQYNEDKSMQQMAQELDALATSQTVKEAVIKANIERMRTGVVDPDIPDIVAERYWQQFKEGLPTGARDPNVAPKADALDYDPEDLKHGIFNPLRTGKGKLGMGINPEHAIAGLTTGTYNSDWGTVVVREGVQNAIDALQNRPGKVSIRVLPADNKIIIIDDGVGMSPDEVATKFVDFAESGKTGDTSAGQYGVAKVALLGRDENFVMTTVADVNGQKIKTTIEGDTKRWASGDVDIIEEIVDPKTPTGTYLEVKLNADAAKDARWLNVRRYIRSLTTISQRSNVEIDGYIGSFKDEYGITEREVILNSKKDTTYSFEEIDTTPISVADLPSAVVETYFSKEKHIDTDNWVNIHVLNHGIYQYTTGKRVQGAGVPREIVVNIRSKVGTNDSNYPFSISRESLKGETLKEVNRMLEDVSNFATEKEARILLKAFVDDPVKIGNENQKLYDTSAKVTPEMQHNIANRPYMTELVRVFSNVLDALGIEISQRIGQKEFSNFIFGGIDLNNGHLGVNLNVSGMKKTLSSLLHDDESKLRLSVMSDKNVILINPFIMFWEISRLQRILPGVKLHELLAEVMMATNIHEIAHQVAKGHRDEFSAAHTRISTKADRIKSHLYGAIDQLAEKLLNDPEFLNDFALITKELDEQYGGSHKNVFDKWAGHETEQRLETLSGIDNFGSSESQATTRSTSGIEGLARQSTDKGSGRTVQPTGPDVSQISENIRPINDIVRRFIEESTAPSFDALVKDFAVKNNVVEEKIPALKEFFRKKLLQETLQSLEPEERIAFEKLRQDIPAQREAILEHYADSKGLRIDREDAGVIAIRDSESGKLLMKVNSETEARQYIKDSGEPNGPELDGGGNNAIPPNLTKEIVPPSGGPPRRYEAPDFLNGGKGRLERALASLNVIAPVMTSFRNIFTSIDSLWKTTLLRDVFDSLQVARSKANSLIRPWYEHLKAIDNLTEGISKEDRAVINSYRESATPDEVAKRGMHGKPATDIEISLGKLIHSSKADMPMVFKYIEMIDEAIKKDKLKRGTPEFDERDKQLRVELGISNAELSVINLISNARTHANLGLVLKIARAFERGMSKQDFAINHKMTGRQIDIADRLDKMMEPLAKVFGIDDVKEIDNYLNHARIYYEGNLLKALDDFNIHKEARNLYEKMAGTGDLDAYEVDPIRAMQRFIKAGFDALYFYDGVNDARKAIRNNIAKLPEQSREQATRLANMYIADLRGNPGAGARFTQSVVDEYFKAMGIKTSIDVRKHIVNILLATGEAAAQGFRIVAGLRDFRSTMAYYYSRFGVARTTRMLELGLRGMDNTLKERAKQSFGLDEISLKSMMEAGIVQGLSPVLISTPLELTTSSLGRTSHKLGKFLRRVSEYGLKFSGQKDIYQLMQYGTYLDTWSTAVKLTDQFVRKEIDKPKMYDKLKLDTYERAVAVEFDRLISQQKFDEAAKFLARQTVEEQVGIYGLAHHPAYWGNNIGRTFGQFGTWPVWARLQGQRAISRGTYKHRAAALTRFVMAEAAWYGTGIALGINFNNWFIWNALAFSGGPAAEFTEDVLKAIGGQGMDQNIAQGRLKRWLPYDPTRDRWNLKQLYIPGSYFLYDLNAAWKQFEHGENALSIAGRAAGLKTQEEQRLPFGIKY
jgi:hypothetical protein